MTWKPLPPEVGWFPTTDISDSLAAVAKRLGAAPPEAQTSVFGYWSELVGEEISAHTSPLSLIDGTLTVQVDEQRWVTQLKWMTAKIAEHLNSLVGEGTVKRIDVRLERANTGK